MKKPLLSVLILVLEKRDWKPLLLNLGQQRSKLTDPTAVEILTESDNGTLSSGVKRQRLVNRAKGKYRCFLDDDDWIANNYLQALVTGCKSNSDVITFILETFPISMAYWQRKPLEKEFWKFGLYPDHRQHGLMTVNHLCAWKSSIANRVGWCPFLGYGDDQLWYKPLFAADLVSTQYHIDEPLYHYRLNLAASANQSRSRKNFALNYFCQGVSCYWMGKEIVIESRSVMQNHRNGKMLVINSKGKEVTVPISKLEFYAKVHL